MLKRRSIRTKLIIALTLLSGVVSLLAVSGFWGLYGYRKLANAVSQRAKEVPYAHDLNRLARTLQSSHKFTRSLHSRGMIDSLPLGSAIFHVEVEEQENFDAAMFHFGIVLSAYEDAIEASAQGGPLVVDTTRHQSSLDGIYASFAILDDFREKPRSLDLSRPEQLAEMLDQLVEQTDAHLAMINSEMAVFSEDVRGQYRTWIRVAWSCTIFSFLMLAILVWYFRSLVIKPFGTLLEGSRLVAGGEFDHRIDLGTGDELSELADAMNDMTDRFQGALNQVKLWCTDLDRQVQERTREVVQNEQLASVGFLAAGVAHEINNPLAAIAWSSESLQSRIGEAAMQRSEERFLDDETCEALTTNLRRIEDEAYRCKGITEKLLDFSRLSEVRRASTDIVALVQDVVEMVGKVGKYRCKALRTHCDGPVNAHVNPQEIRQVVLNLVTNALESVESEGAVDVYVATKNKFASIVVEDNGCGMSHEVLKHLFEPFFTRRRDGTGTGLGLSITYRIVSQHGGSLTAKSDGENKGSRMEMLLPMTADCNDSTGQRRNTLGPNHESYQTV